MWAEFLMLSGVLFWILLAKRMYTVARGQYRRFKWAWSGYKQPRFGSRFR